ncbi:carboxymuconolactone decarboxylase family protein [Streptomyces tagetis]|uniref:Carboxymuconolactone decarboxylase family protein n=1 Tax=Streptomyces tagetis TaxID=2820809 RepID=A0A940XG74_9ACTN|nr:carboxymuconolactone decarboxylase family protein [Streptomyces sp. RG38]MBQ0826547.1 carboxymuconolactone decarboxylase family protein [Streptomyces sp. RG38]
MTAPHSDLYETGLRIRREVLGEAHVDRSLAAASDFSRVAQDFVTEHCWGALWARDGLERKTRSMLNLVMLAALNRNHELGVHVRGAITNGVTEDEIRECLLQVAVYCGMPAALEAFRVADGVLRDLRDQD